MVSQGCDHFPIEKMNSNWIYKLFYLVKHTLKTEKFKNNYVTKRLKEGLNGRNEVPLVQYPSSVCVLNKINCVNSINNRVNCSLYWLWYLKVSIWNLKLLIGINRHLMTAAVTISILSNSTVTIIKKVILSKIKTNENDWQTKSSKN